MVNLHAFKEKHGTLAAHYGISLKMNQTVLGHSDANLTANIYAELPTRALFPELKRLPWVAEPSVGKVLFTNQLRALNSPNTLILL